MSTKTTLTDSTINSITPSTTNSITYMYTTDKTVLFVFLCLLKEYINRIQNWIESKYIEQTTL